MAQYAATTSVSVEKTRAEIEFTIRRYGASQFGYAEDSDRGLASIQFSADGRHVRFTLTLPNKSEFRMSPEKRRVRSDAQTHEAWQQACRQRWRALFLCIKAKLEAVECGIAEFEAEFMAHIVLPGGGTVGQLMKPQIEKAYLTGDCPPGISGLLAAPEEGAIHG